MLGSIATKNYFATSNSIGVLPKVVAEWNGNTYGEPYFYNSGTTVSSFSSGTAPSNLVCEVGTSNFTKTAGGGTFGDLYSITYPPTEGDGTTQSVYSFSYSTSSPANAQSVKFSFFAYTENSPATVTVFMQGYNTGGMVDSKTYTIDVYQSVKKPFLLDFFSYASDKFSQVTTVNVKFIVSYAKDPQADTTPNLILKIDSPKFYVATRFNSKNDSVIPISSIANRVYAGEAFVDADTFGNTVLTNNYSVSPYYIAFEKSKLNIEKTSGKDLCRNYLPSQYSKFKYTIIDTSFNYSSVYIRYKNKVRTNKLVIKVNPLGMTPQSISLSFLTNPTTDTWTNQTITGVSSFSNNGLLVLYFNGTTWQKTPWTNVPKMVGGALDGSNSYKDIYGVRVTFSTPGGLDNTQTAVHLVEVSPRFQVDLSNYIISFDIKKELSNDSLPLPIGIANSNTASVSFSNIPDKISGINIFPFSNDSTNESLLKNLIDKDVKFSFFISPNDTDITETVQVATMFTSSWKSSFDMTSEAQCFDSMKYLGSLFPPIMYRKSTPVTSIVSDILDSVGFTDYDWSALRKMSSDIISHFWTVRDKTVLETLQELLLPHQISMYIDEYGVIKFQLLSSIKSKSNSNPDFIATDNYYASGLKYSDNTTDMNFESNIISYDENIENRPSEISVGYTSVMPRSMTYTPAGIPVEKYEIIWKASDSSIGYIVLSKDLPYYGTELFYAYDINASYIESYSGYLIIGQEVIKYDGQKYVIDNKEYIIKSKEQLDYIVNSLVSSGVTNAKPIPKYILCNLTRGMFGTTPVDHKISESALTSFTQLKDTDSGRTSVTNRLSQGITASPTSPGIILSPSTATDANRTIAMFNTSTSSNNLVYNLTFKLLDIPKVGEPVRVGLVVGATNGARDGRLVELVIYRHKFQDSQIIVDSLVRSYRLTNTDKFDENKHYFFRGYWKKVKDKKGKLKNVPRISGKQDNSLNVDDTNTLTVVLGPDRKTMAVFVNGNVIQWSGISNAKYLKASFRNTPSNSKSNRFIKIPSLPLDQAVTTASTKFGVFAHGPSRVLIQGVESFPLEYTDSYGTAEMIASVAYGNQFGISNKDEIDAIIHGIYKKDDTTPIGYTPSIVAREAQLFNFDYEQAPARWSSLTKVASYRTSAQKYQSKIPSEAVASSDFCADTAGTRFVLANSWTSPIYLNYQNSATNVSGSSTYIVASVLEPKYKKYVSIKTSGDDKQSVKLDSEWIQNEFVAKNMLSDIYASLIMKRSNLSIQLFGNPLIQIGDVMGFKYAQKGIDLKNYIVTSVNLGYNNGITTNVTLRRIQE